MYVLFSYHSFEGGFTFNNFVVLTIRTLVFLFFFSTAVSTNTYADFFDGFEVGTCTYNNLSVGTTSKQDVMKKLGKPSRVTTNEYIYSKSREFLRVKFSSDGFVQKLIVSINTRSSPYSVIKEKVINALGEPSSEGLADGDGTYRILYDSDIDNCTTSIMLDADRPGFGLAIVGLDE